MRESCRRACALLSRSFSYRRERLRKRQRRVSTIADVARDEGAATTDGGREEGGGGVDEGGKVGGNAGANSQAAEQLQYCRPPKFGRYQQEHKHSCVFKRS